MIPFDIPPLPVLLTYLPERHAQTPLDIILLLVLFNLPVVGLLSPCTSGWKLFRVAVFAPIVVFGYLWYGFKVSKPDRVDTWGTAISGIYIPLRITELFIIYPAEETDFRVRPYPVQPENIDPDHPVMMKEEVPAPWTLAKLDWAFSLFWSYRGIGWNYIYPLPHSSTSYPQSRSSSRKAFLTHRFAILIIDYLIFDTARSIMDLSEASTFFSRPDYAPTPVVYNMLTQWQRGVYSACVLIRIWYSVEMWAVLCSLFFVSLGGVFGLEGEMWSPWGFPPVFGSLGNIWRHPGLSTMWSKTWHQYFRRWLYIFGWIGLGQNILRLPISGPSVRPIPPDLMDSSTSLVSNGNRLAPKSATSQTSTPSSVTRSSTPTHPISTIPTKKQMTTKMIIANFIKSMIVFLLSGFIHELGTLCLILDSPYLKSNAKWRDLFTLTPFFGVQPFALIGEAFVKRQWRTLKRSQFGINHSAQSHHSPSQKSKTHPEPSWLIFLERLIGFIWTWTWLGWSAGWFIEGLAKSGMYIRRDGLPLYFSVIGGLVWGKWMH